MTLTKRQEKALEKAIELLYYAHANGRQINVMKIGALFRDARAAHLAGVDLETAVKAAIDKHCEPTNI